MIEALFLATVLQAQAPLSADLLRQAQELQARSDAAILEITVRRMEFILFHQTIHDASVTRLEGLLTGREQILDLQSQGGDLEAAIRMARKVREQRARVRVTGECRSECAVIWAAATERMGRDFEAVTFEGEAPGGPMGKILSSAGVSPWLLTCAARLQQTGDWEVVWFPPAVLQAAGIGQLDRHDRPNARQMTEIETVYGEQAPRRIYWAEDGDCDPERAAAVAG